MPTYQVYIRRGSDYAIIDKVDDWISCKAVRRFNGIGTFELKVRANFLTADLMTQTAGIAIDRDGTYIFSGRCTRLIRTATTVTMVGEDDNGLLRSLARPTPSQATGAFSTEFDTRTDIASTVMIDLVHENIGQTAPTSPINWRIAQLTTPSDPLLGGTITSVARFERLIDLLADLAVSPVAGGLGFQIMQSDAFVQNIEFTVYEPRDQREIAIFSTDTQTAQDYEDIWQAPEHAYFYAMLGDGLGADRTVLEGGNDTAIGEMGFRAGGLLELRAVEDGTTGAQKLAEAVAGATPTRRVKIIPVDIRSLNYGEHWDLGDLVTVAINGVTYEQVIREVEINLTPTEGAQIIPTIADAGATNDDRTAQHIASVKSRVAYLEANYRLPSEFANSPGIIRIGGIIMWPQAGPPTGWLLCDGTVLARATYPDLFDQVGTSFNTGGETGSQFRLPNLSGRVPLGVNGSHAIGTSGGAESVTPDYVGGTARTGVVFEAGGAAANTLDTTVNLTHGGTDKVARDQHTHGMPAIQASSVMQPFLSIFFIIRAL